MRFHAILSTAAGLLIALPAAAQDRPLLQPNRDVMVEYRVTGSAGAPPGDQTLRMNFTDGGNKVRVEVVGQPNYTIMERSAHHMTVVLPAQHSYMEMPLDPRQTNGLDSKDGSFTRRGTETIAGVKCTVYDGKTAQYSGQICATSDGVLLQTKSNNPGAGGNMEAVKVSYGPQPASLFQPPAGFQKTDMGAMMRAAPPAH